MYGVYNVSYKSVVRKEMETQCYCRYDVNADSSDQSIFLTNTRTIL